MKECKYYSLMSVHLPLFVLYIVQINFSVDPAMYR